MNPLSDIITGPNNSAGRHTGLIVIHALLVMLMINLQMHYMLCCWACWCVIINQSACAAVVSIHNCNLSIPFLLLSANISFNALHPSNSSELVLCGDTPVAFGHHLSSSWSFYNCVVHHLIWIICIFDLIYQLQ